MEKYNFVFSDKDILELKAFYEELELGDSVLAPLVNSIVKETWWYKDIMKNHYKIKYRKCFYSLEYFKPNIIVGFLYRITILKDPTIEIFK